MNDQIQQMMDVATGVMNGIFITTGKSDVYFKQMIELEKGQGKQLLVVGSVHRDYDDGHVIAVLNPDEALLPNLEGGMAYDGALLKYLVAERCKAMVFMSCTGRRTSLLAKYHARGK
jgi:hypothetical protein